MQINFHGTEYFATAGKIHNPLTMFTFKKILIDPEINAFRRNDEFKDTPSKITL